eukprot:GGOE01048671.1.p5 GENE.GGOE01048671.1~~GGOE01048671.1.p5  ORF type:complete len:105 (-),score=3.85 GGOE01048671.1:373-687(-)
MLLHPLVESKPQHSGDIERRQSGSGWGTSFESFSTRKAPPPVQGRWPSLRVWKKGGGVDDGDTDEAGENQDRTMPPGCGADHKIRRSQASRFAAAEPCSLTQKQ